MGKKLNDYLAMPYRMELVEDQDEGEFVVSYLNFGFLEACTDHWQSILRERGSA